MVLAATVLLERQERAVIARVLVGQPVPETVPEVSAAAARIGTVGVEDRLDASIAHNCVPFRETRSAERIRHWDRAFFGGGVLVCVLDHAIMKLRTALVRAAPIRLEKRKRALVAIDETVPERVAGSIAARIGTVGGEDRHGSSIAHECVASVLRAHASDRI